MSFNIIRSDINEITADAAVLIDGQKLSALIHAENIITVPEPAADKDSTAFLPQAEKTAISEVYEKCLGQALEKGCESIVFPLISLPEGCIERHELIGIAVSVFREYLEDNDIKITLAVSDTSDIFAGDRISDLDSYIEARIGDRFFGAAMGAPMMSIMSPAEFTADDEEFSDEAAATAEDKGKNGFGAREKKTAAKKESFIEHFFGRRAESSEAMMCASAPQPTVRMDRSLDDVMSQIKENWQESLLRLIDEKGYTDTEVYKRANVDRKLFSKIRCNADYQPKKITAIAFALALRLNLDETRDILGRAGYALSPSSRFDLIIQYFIEHEVYDIYTINLALFEHDQPLLGE